MTPLKSVGGISSFTSSGQAPITRASRAACGSAVGRSTPDGNLEFQFQVGSLNFKSTSMDWLVVTGEPRSIFRGTGRINMAQSAIQRERPGCILGGLRRRAIHVIHPGVRPSIRCARAIRKGGLAWRMVSTYSAKPAEVLPCPAGLLLDNRFQGFDCEGIAAGMGRYCDPASVLMVVALVRSLLANEVEAIALQGCDELPRGERTQATIVNGHALSRQSQRCGAPLAKSPRPPRSLPDPGVRVCPRQ